MSYHTFNMHFLVVSFGLISLMGFTFLSIVILMV